MADVDSGSASPADPAFFEGDYGVMLLGPLDIKNMDIGGGMVRYPFRMGTKYMKHGDMLTPEQVLAMPAATRSALMNQGMLAVWPKGSESPIGKGKRYAIHMGGGAYDVIEGRKLNDGPLTREEAKELAEKRSH